MFITKILSTIGKLALGKEISAAWMLLQLIREARTEHSLENVSRYVYSNLPERWKSPDGPSTEAEFIELIQSGQTFLNNVQAVLKA